MKRISFTLNLIAFLFYQSSIFSNPIPSGSAFSIVAPTTITMPGSYRLANDIVGTITIAADNVALNLENRKLTAGVDGIVISGQSDVAIRNGTVEGATVNGIEIDTCNNIIIEDIDFTSNATGILVLTTTSIRINNCSFREQTDESLCIADVGVGEFLNCSIKQGTGPRAVLINDSRCLKFSNIVICDNTFSGGQFEGFRGDRLEDVHFLDCRVDNNISSNALEGWLFTAINDVALLQCSVSSNNASSMIGINIATTSTNIKFSEIDICNNIATTTSLSGIECIGVSNGVFNDCRINGNSNNNILTGFTIGANSKNFKLNNCSASGNTTSSVDMHTGFLVDSSKNVDFQHCCASGNVGGLMLRAFDICNASECSFESCIANDNTTLNGGLRGFRFSNSDNGRLIDCLANKNEASDRLNAYHLRTGCRNIEFYRCTANDNSSFVINSTVRGFQVENSQAILFDLCVSNSNVATGDDSSVAGFRVGSGSSQDIIFDSCIANQNTASGVVSIGMVTSHGFDIESDVNCLINCKAKLNAATIDSIGISLGSSSSNTTVRNCIAKNNIGGMSSIGFFNAGINNVFFLNEAQGHGVLGVTNFSGAGPVATYNPVGFTLTTSQSIAIDNISIVLP